MINFVRAVIFNHSYSFLLMKIIVIGIASRLDEFRKIISGSHDIEFFSYEEKKSEQSFSTANLIVDLNLDEFPERINLYKNLNGKIVLCGAVKKSLSFIVKSSNDPVQCILSGFNSLPSFISRKLMEVSFLNPEAKEKFSAMANEMNWEWREVKDTAGMVTPRVISMLINEACFEMEEGTASKEDIDKGMKLGTAYPIGPLEWADRIGIKNVYETLEAIYNETGDARYTISALLKNMNLQEKKFYP
jgi:3-hydroxybutyryl-CoA dehydrogenase